MAGVQANVQARFRAWAEAFEHSPLIESSLGILLFTVMLTVWSRVTGHVLSEAQQDLLEATRAGMAGEIGQELYALRRLRNDQAAYAVTAARLAEKISLNLASEMALDRRQKDSERNSRSLFSYYLHLMRSPKMGLMLHRSAKAGYLISTRPATAYLPVATIV